MRWTIGRKLGLVFAVIALSLATIGAVVSFRVGDMLLGLGRVLEEQREESLARELARSLDAIGEHFKLLGDRPLESDARAVLAAAYGDATRALDALERGPRGRDPSEELHAAAEVRLYAALRGHLEELGRELETATLGASARAALSRAHELAIDLHDEMSSEAGESGATLRERGREMRREVTWITIATLAVLGLVVWMVERHVIRPIKALRAGVTRIAGGDLGQSVRVGASDEIGELAQEFNHMASELRSVHAELEQRVEQRTQEFLRAARLAGLGTLAAGVAHEINNPLASIASCAEGLQRKLEGGGASVAQQREYLQIIANEAYRAHGITSRLLDFARSDPGPKTFFSLRDLMSELGVLLEHRLRSRGLELAVECDADLPAIEGNASECKQVLLILIHNAIDASPDGATIHVRCREQQRELVLEVEDHGPGIAPEHLERIFDPFFTTKPPGQGTGLGLAIAYRIVESHGGRIRAENTGSGARFSVLVPMPAERVA